MTQIIRLYCVLSPSKILCCRVCGLDGRKYADWRYLTEAPDHPYWLCSDECAELAFLNPLGYGL